MINCFSIRSFVFILLLLSFYSGIAQSIQINDSSKLFNLANTSYYLEDPSGKRTIEEISTVAAAAEFKPLGKNFVNFGVSSSVYWLKCSLQNKTDHKLLLEIGNSNLTDVKVYEAGVSDPLQFHHTGNWLPFHQRVVKDVNYQFELNILPQAAGQLFIRVQSYRGTQFPLSVGSKSAFYSKTTSRSLLEGMYYGFMLLMVLYNLFIYFTLKDVSYLYYVLYIFFMGLWNACRNGYAFKYFWPSTPQLNQYVDVVAALLGIASIKFAIHFLNTKRHTSFLHKLLQLLIILYIISVVILTSGNLLLGTVFLELLSLFVVIILFVTAYVTLRRGYRPAIFFFIAWSFLLLSVIIFILKDFNLLPYTSLTVHSMQIGSALEALLLSLALANRINIYKKEKEQARIQTMQSLEENKKLIQQQNMVLEKKVEERTLELKMKNKELIAALENLKVMQTQLIQTEKMASLGELTAGIAHEIKNPLNFINNFAEVNAELIDEMKNILTDNSAEGLAIAESVKENNLKIVQHGERADAIVTNMLEHSRTGKGEKQPVAINSLVEEYFRLSYHGFRAKDKSFNATVQSTLDDSIGKIKVVQQDISRVLLNLFNNAFFAVNEKKKILKENYEPFVLVTTKNGNNWIEICVRDNGMGISTSLLDKIFQPFFTTKPSGQGTGLGLSLSYDIITKGHGGELQVTTKEGEYAEFIIRLPV